MNKPTMLLIRVAFTTPFDLGIAEGDYATFKPGETISLMQTQIRTNDGATQRRSMFSMIVEAPDTQDADELSNLTRRYAARLLTHANRLLRWYRAVSRQAQIGELTLAQARRFTYERVDTRQPWTADYETGIVLPSHAPRPIDMAEVETAVRSGLLTGTDPELADLYLLDAEQFLREGRFREAILNCWSVIDATFTMRFEKLAEQKLQGEWSDGLKAFSSHESGLKHRMSVGMHFVAGRSLFREPGNLWQEMAASYDKRNGIIHRGETADNADAALAIRVAATVVAIMDEVEAQAAAANAPTA